MRTNRFNSTVATRYSHWVMGREDLVDCSYSLPPAPVRSACMNTYNRVTSRSKTHRWTVHKSHPRAAQDFHWTVRRNAPIPRASPTTAPSTSSNRWRGRQAVFPTLKMTSLASTKLIGSCDSRAGKTSVPVREAEPQYPGCASSLATGSVCWRRVR